MGHMSQRESEIENIFHVNAGVRFIRVIYRKLYVIQSRFI